MLIGYDSVTLGAIPHNPQVVFAYDDGLYSDLAVARRLFPHAHVFSIAVRAEDNGDFLDIERGDAVVSDAHNWLARQLHRGVWRPGLYGSLSIMGQITDAIRSLGLTREQYRLWSAHYTGMPHIEPGCDGTQWTDKALGRNLDESLLHATFIPLRPAKPAAVIDAALVEYNRSTGQWTVTGQPGVRT
jgi:hypothetical protein